MIGAVGKAFLGDDSLDLMNDVVISSTLGLQNMGGLPFTTMMSPGVLGAAFATTQFDTAYVFWTGKLAVKRYRNSCSFTNFTDAPVTLDLYAVAPRKDWMPEPEQEDPSNVIRGGFGQTAVASGGPPTSFTGFNGTTTFTIPGISFFENPAFVQNFKVKKRKTWKLRPGQTKTWTRTMKKQMTIQFNRLLTQKSSDGSVPVTSADFYAFLRGFTFLCYRLIGAPVTSGSEVSYSPAKVGMISKVHIDFMGLQNTSDTRYYANSLATTGTYVRPVNPVHALNVPQYVPVTV